MSFLVLTLGGHQIDFVDSVRNLGLLILVGIATSANLFPEFTATCNVFDIGPSSISYIILKSNWLPHLFFLVLITVVRFIVIYRIIQILNFKDCKII